MITRAQAIIVSGFTEQLHEFVNGGAGTEGSSPVLGGGSVTLAGPVVGGNGDSSVGRYPKTGKKKRQVKNRRVKTEVEAIVKCSQERSKSLCVYGVF